MHKKTNLSRRHFLQATSFTAAAAPFLLPSHVWSADVSPNNRIVMGCMSVNIGSSPQAETLRTDEPFCEECERRQEHLRRLKALLEKLGTIRRLQAELESKYFNDILERIAKPEAAES